jgi:hypothetical protein
VDITDRRIGMKVCDNTESNGRPELISGHIYKAGEEYVFDDSGLHIYALGINTLVCLDNGSVWAEGKGFGVSEIEWKDVTDEYCLQKVK